MSGAVYTTATLDVSDVEEGLHAMERRARQLGPLFHELKAPMRVDQKEHAAQKAGPEGPWPPRAPSTLRAHPKRAKRKLLGRLPTAVVYKSTAHSVSGESRVRWSLAHQDGDRVGRGARLQARPFLYISDGFVQFAADLLDLSIIRAWEGA